jgi:branched-chain amino acid transport system ATP-binding protein
VSAPALLDARGIDLHYGRIQILFDVSISVAEHEMVALLGTNGAGKSTFLKAVSNVSPVSRGTVTFAGDDVTTMPADAIAARGLAHVPGGRGLLADLTVDENLRLGGHLLRGRAGRVAMHDGIDRAFTLFPWMPARRRQLAGTLSGGEQQMLAIARALVTNPRMLMIDELSLGLAPIIVEELMRTLTALRGSGITILLVEQHATFAMQFCDRVVFMEKGQVRFSGNAADLVGRTDLLRSVFLGGASAAELLG